jgi:hypothetical protein
MNHSPKTFLAVAMVLPMLLSAALRADDWPQWRGPVGTGTASNADPSLVLSAPVFIRLQSTSRAERCFSPQIKPATGQANALESQIVATGVRHTCCW